MYQKYKFIKGRYTLVNEASPVGETRTLSANQQTIIQDKVEKVEILVNEFVRPIKNCKKFLKFILLLFIISLGILGFMGIARMARREDRERSDKIENRRKRKNSPLINQIVSAIAQIPEKDVDLDLECQHRHPNHHRHPPIGKYFADCKTTKIDEKTYSADLHCELKKWCPKEEKSIIPTTPESHDNDMDVEDERKDLLETNVDEENSDKMVATEGHLEEHSFEDHDRDSHEGRRLMSSSSSSSDSKERRERRSGRKRRIKRNKKPVEHWRHRRGCHRSGIGVYINKKLFILKSHPKHWPHPHHPHFCPFLFMVHITHCLFFALIICCLCHHCCKKRRRKRMRRKLNRFCQLENRDGSNVHMMITHFKQIEFDIKENRPERRRPQTNPAQPQRLQPLIRPDIRNYYRLNEPRNDSMISQNDSPQNPNYPNNR